jgi:hypothetical protein
MLYRVFYIDNDDKIFKSGADAKTYGCFIFIKRTMKHDKCLLEHELEHVKQFWRLQSWRSKCYKEKHAYKKQYLCQGKRNKSFFINMISKYCKKKNMEEISKFLG